jgi:hypothetical protein
MARRKIKIMISSRCNDRFPANGGTGSRALSEIRAQLKQEIEGEKLFGKEAFESLSPNRHALNFAALPGVMTA